jgi:hypothetical protein
LETKGFHAYGQVVQKPKKLPRDMNARAARIVALSTGQIPPEEANPEISAVRAKAGKARADSLSAKKRQEIAKIAAAARWKKSGD